MTKQSRKLGFINAVAFLLTIGLLASMVFLMVRVDAGTRTIAELSQNNDALRDQLLAENIKPVAPPSETVTGQPGSPGPRGDIGLRGPGPTDAQVQDAVAGFCILRDGCAGRPGTAGAAGSPGTAGTDGNDSTVPGPAGPPGSDSTVPGPTGPAGQPGTDGRGLAALECQPDGTWLITYTDGTTSTTEGPCRVDIIPIPE